MSQPESPDGTQSHPYGCTTWLAPFRKRKAPHFVRNLLPSRFFHRLGFWPRPISWIVLPRTTPGTYPMEHRRPIRSVRYWLAGIYEVYSLFLSGSRAPQTTVAT